MQVGSVEEGERAAAAGVDGVIAQGSEAGGHVRSVTSIWEILPATVEVLAPLPVLASGGIGDGAGIAKALGLGAAGVSMGTRFVASEEAWIHQAYKERVVQSNAEDTVRVEDLFNIGWPDAPHRVIRNRIVEEWEAVGRPAPGDRPGEGTNVGTFNPPWDEEGEEYPLPRYAVAMIPPTFVGDVEYTPMWAGVSVGEMSEIKPAGEIVSDLVKEAEIALAASSD